MVDVDQLVDTLADVIHGTVRAVVSTADGRLLARSTGLSPSRATDLTTFATAITALTTAAAEATGATHTRHTTVEMTGGVLVVTTLPDGTVLSVLTVLE